MVQDVFTIRVLRGAAGRGVVWQGEEAMSWKFDKSEVPQFDGGRDEKDAIGERCVACPFHGWCDSATGLCVDCWRIVVLGPAMANR